MTIGEVLDYPYYGFWGMAHEARTDFSMLRGSIFLLIVGAGAWSIDVFGEIRNLSGGRQYAKNDRLSMSLRVLGTPRAFSRQRHASRNSLL
jgi:hypothetical protein